MSELHITRSATKTSSKTSHKLSRREQSLSRLETFRKEITTNAHTIPLDELFLSLGTDPVSGLCKQEAADLLKKNGPNALTPSRKKSEIAKFVGVLFRGFSNLLWIGAGLCFLSALIRRATTGSVDVDNLVLGGVLVIVVMVTGMFTYYQERKSQGIMESFANMVPPKATVIRDGEALTILSKDIVVGDVVDITFGDRVPADIRIIHSQNLKVDNSPLTGETEPQPRSNVSAEENFLEAKNVAFFSTNVVEGTGRGVVIGCGDHTVMGHIAGLTARLQPNQTPMAKELSHFMKIISAWACFLGVSLGIACLALGRSPLETLLFVIGIIVANVPEGLLATVIVCLTVTAKKMASLNCIVKKLESVETLGSTSIICSDKTGTLTLNRMTVCNLWFNGIMVDAPTAKKKYKDHPAFRNLLRCASLCNRAEFFSGQDHLPIERRQVRGDASESAVLKFVTAISDPQYSRERNPKLIEIPFSSATKYQISVHALENRKCLLLMKGAPEVVLERCTHIFHGNATKTMSDDMMEICNQACTRFAESGERVLAFCDLELEEKFTVDYHFSLEPANFPQRGLRFLGFIAMIDPPRPQVPDAIRKCKSAGIKVAMVTGDHPITAKAIAVKVGIITDKTVHDFATIDAIRKNPPSSGAVVIRGSVLTHLLQDELDEILSEHPEIVFARTSPTQKLQIVEGYQRLGEIVAVTGDGVNDAPALKKADIGVAMGITGTEVSQQAADIILLDDNFASIISGIEEGRRIFDNLKKSITYTLASNVPEILPFLAYSFIDIPLPLGIVAILCIDLLTDMMPAISLAYEKAESDIMKRPPRNPLRDKLVSRKLYFLAYGNLGLLEALGGFYVYFNIMAEYGFLPKDLLGIRTEWEHENVTLKDSYGRSWSYQQRKFLECTCYTAFMMSVVVAQWANLIACKTRLNSIVKQGMMQNKVLLASLVVETVFTCILAYSPYMYYLDFFPIHWRWWLYALPWAALLLLYDEFRKWHIRKYPKGWYQRETFY